MPVKAEPSIAGKAPTKEAEFKLVKAEPSPVKVVAARVPVTIAPWENVGAPVPVSSVIVPTLIVLII
tara:strand:- start:46 stop:246 length:201 start_codon:yes stop_codon:yes gene_type:complete